MTSIESHTSSFIIKIWLEEEPGDGHAGVWRGSITHVESGKRRYLTSLMDIPEAIRPYLEAWGLKALPHGPTDAGSPQREGWEA